MNYKERKKVSLYFKPETLLELTRLKDMLILTGMPSYKLPSMHGMINGFITYGEKILYKYPIDRERFRDYIKGEIRRTHRELKIEKIEEEKEEEIEEFEQIEENRIGKETGRFLFKMEEPARKSLENIQKYLKEPITEMALIRALIEFLLLEQIDKFTIMTEIYTGALYELEPSTAIELMRMEEISKEKLRELKREEREIIRKIGFDRGTLEILEKGIKEHKIDMGKKVMNIPYKKIRYGIYTSTYNKIVKKTQSKANSFNYTIAHIGNIIMTEMIYENIESITQAIIQIQKISKHPAIQDIEYIKKLLEASILLNNTPEIL